MDMNSPMFQYLWKNLGLAFAAILFSLAVENWKNSQYKYIVAVFASILLTPLGAWILSLFWRLGESKTEQVTASL